MMFFGLTIKNIGEVIQINSTMNSAINVYEFSNFIPVHHMNSAFVKNAEKMRL